MSAVQSNERRAELLAIAAKLFAERGLRATTVRDIADAAGILSGSLYHHFDSKDAILDEILRRYLDTIRQRYADVLATDGSATERLHNIVLASLRTAAEHPHATAIYQNELHYLREQERYQPIQGYAADIQRTWMKIIKGGVADGSFRDDIDPRVFYRLIRDAVWLSVRYSRPNHAASAERMAADVTAVFLNGFSAPRRPPRKRAST